MTPTELCDRAEALAYAKADHILLYLPQVAETLKLVPQLAAALREACGLLEHYVNGTGFRPGLSLRQQARAFLARDVEVPTNEQA